MVKIFIYLKVVVLVVEVKIHVVTQTNIEPLKKFALIVEMLFLSVINANTLKKASVASSVPTRMLYQLMGYHVNALEKIALRL